MLMKTENCLTRALDQWDNDRYLILYYNNNHVVSLEPGFTIRPYIFDDKDGLPVVWKYEPLERYGSQHFIVSFKLSMRHLKLLGEYFNSLSNTKIV